jgi:hypothetical protein
LDNYFCGMSKPLFNYYWIEVAVSGNRGKELAG